LDHSAQGDPIVGVDFIVEEEAKQAPAPPPPEMEKKSFFRQLKDAFQFKKEEQPKKELAMTDTSRKLQAKIDMKDMNDKPSLVDKSGKDFNRPFAKLDSLVSDAQVQSKLADHKPAASGGPAFADLPAQKLADKSFRVSAADIPIQVARIDGGLSRKGDEDAPVIAVSKKSDKGFRSVSSAFSAPPGAEGAGSSGGKSGSPLAGSGFANSAILQSRDTANQALSGSYGSGASGGGAIGRSYSGSGGGFSSGAVPAEVAEEARKQVTQLTQNVVKKTAAAENAKSPYALSGPLANRKILSQALPALPDWARRQGLITYVSLYFFVLHTGEVKNNVVIQRTSGDPRLDNVAVEALMRWRFEPLSTAQYGREQWGIITFKFRAR
jgi:TonB family protein